MDEQKEMRRNEPGVDTNDQPAEGGPYIEKSKPNQASGSTQPTSADHSELAPLFEKDATDKFQSRWLVIQSKFVDDPGDSVKQADSLVADIIQDITDNFANRRSTLEKDWNGGGQASTEDLRIALQQYRSFFNRLLSLES